MRARSLRPLGEFSSRRKVWCEGVNPLEKRVYSSDLGLSLEGPSSCANSRGEAARHEGRVVFVLVVIPCFGAGLFGGRTRRRS